VAVTVSVCVCLWLCVYELGRC